ncbi:class I SAM-dependent methyltransferase [Aspergillus homomorphus CBS 101889]|uniref:Methyltransferase domain-containing protein n=1 Tax=Aspergillus homomorphus (strain CBS 101889) TaxID=1450537 RepID=A0A395I3C5_ASPHC|nr:methyltransferase domain-containing protein [Aspergillus homomorphus CBS 101889]RAL14113.1 methyltransferase domain-containing protein [Aspergillus homomorphus CBS 101889]
MPNMAESNLKAEKTAESYSWYEPNLTQVQEPARTLLAEYSHIPEEQIIEHVKEVRDRAFAVFPYPCIGSFRFLDITINHSPAYAEILSRLKTSDHKYLDLGCAMGQDIRYLTHQGAPSTNLYGSDLHPEFIELGYDLFSDRATLSSEFIPSDIFDDGCPLLTRLAGQIDIVNAASFFHLFDWTQQVALAKQIIKLLRPRPGSLLVGRHVGDFEAGERADSELGNTYYRHDLDSWRRMWGEVMRETGTQWEVEVAAEQWEEVKRNRHNRESSFKMVFVVRRV